MTVLGFILYLIVAAVCAWVAEATVPGVIPGGFLTAAIVGIIGGWLGGSLFGSFGPARWRSTGSDNCRFSNSGIWNGVGVERLFEGVEKQSEFSCRTSPRTR